MIKEITIKNYKSILDLTLKLGRFNVFIGENGSGKTNILESIGMLVGGRNDRLSIEDLSAQGIRTAKPDLTFSSFLSKKMNKVISYDCLFEADKTYSLKTKITCDTPQNLYAKWYDIENETWNLKLRNTIDNLSSLKNKKIDQRRSYGIEILNLLNEKKVFNDYIKDYVVFNLNIHALRCITQESLKSPLGINGEKLDVALFRLGKREFNKVLKYKYLIPWLENIVLDKANILKFKDYKAESNSLLYFADKYMKKDSLFNMENANEGILHILFYLVLFVDKKTPNFFAIDNIETALNPSLCRHLTQVLTEINTKKQVLITTHNPAVLDGLDLTNDDIRLFTVRRNSFGYTSCKRIQFTKGVDRKKYKLSEMWMKGLLGAIPKNF